MLKFVTGDLLHDDAEAIVNTVNCVGVMGKGLALQFKRKFPNNYLVYRTACAQRQVKLGEVFVVETGSMMGPKWIVNFPTKGHWKSNSNLDDIRHGLESLWDFIEETQIESVALPPLGAGNGGLAWGDVKPLIEEFAASTPAEIRMYAPSESSRIVAASKINMTLGRALLVKLVDGYAKQRNAMVPWDAVPGASALEVQKLMYFASLGDVDLKLKFVKSFYGPYSEPLRHQLQNMEGYLTEGFGDGTRPVLEFDPISPTGAGRREANDFVAKKPHDGKTVQSLTDAVLQLLEGYETPFGVELLATVHWSSATTGDTSTDRIAADIREWSARKGRMFTHPQIDAAVGHLTKFEVPPFGPPK